MFKSTLINQIPLKQIEASFAENVLEFHYVNNEKFKLKSISLTLPPLYYGSVHVMTTKQRGFYFPIQSDADENTFDIDLQNFNTSITMLDLNEYEISEIVIALSCIKNLEKRQSLGQNFDFAITIN